MCGFLLRAVFLSLVGYLLLATEAALHIVTLGGQILGAAVIGLLTACYHTMGRRFLVNVWQGRILAAIVSGVTMLLVVHVLPGYTVLNVTMFSGIVIFFCIVGYIVNCFIEDK